MMMMMSASEKQSKAGWGCREFRDSRPSDVDAIGIQAPAAWDGLGRVRARATRLSLSTFTCLD
jgi:hypothetical protein